MKLNIIALMLLLIVPAAFASTIHGTIYDISLNQMENVKVTINTLPPQTLISKDGNYKFEAGNGNYTLEAISSEGSVNQGIVIEQDGDYNIDLILFPSTEELPPEDNTTLDFALDQKPQTSESSKAAFYFVLIVIALIFILVIAWLFLRDKISKTAEEISLEESDELKEVVAIIKKMGGRITQKDLRKELPLSEAKISLLVADLESQGIIKKIKKGRGNIIVLEKQK